MQLIVLFFARRGLLVMLLAFLLVSRMAVAQVNSPSKVESTITDSTLMAIDSIAARQLVDIAHHDAFGVRLGTGSRTGTSGLKPIFNPFYDVPVGNVLLCAELMLVYESFQTLDFGTFQQFHFDAYGFNLKVKTIFGSGGSTRPFFSTGPELSVLQTKVSVGLPIVVGVLLPLSQSSGVEVAGNVTPLVYLGQNVGLFYGLTVGIRFLGN